jgi:hypothetical protein
MVLLLSLSDKNESYPFHTSRSTNKQGFWNLVLKTSPLIIKMLQKEYIGIYVKYNKWASVEAALVEFSHKWVQKQARLHYAERQRQSR